MRTTRARLRFPPPHSTCARSRLTPALDWSRVAGRTYKTEAVVLRSLRFSEADRILHLYTRERGRVGAIAKGIRKTKSRFGARLEPLSHVELVLHEGSGELQTVTGVELIGSHHAAREDALPAERRPDRAPRRCCASSPSPRRTSARSPRSRASSTCSTARRGSPSARPALDPLALSFQLKLLWVSGYLPHVTRCVECGAGERLVGFSRPRRRRRLRPSTPRGSLALSPEGLAGIEQLLSTPLADAAAAGLGDRARREALARDHAPRYEEHGGFRLRTLSA